MVRRKRTPGKWWGVVDQDTGCIIAMFDNWNDADRNALEREESGVDADNCEVVGVEPAKTIQTDSLGFLGL